MLSELFDSGTLCDVHYDTPFNKLTYDWITWIPSILFKVKNGVWFGRFNLLEDSTRNKHIHDCAQAPHIHFWVIFDFLLRLDLWCVKNVVHPTDLVLHFKAFGDVNQFHHYDICYDQFDLFFTMKTFDDPYMLGTEIFVHDSICM